jgi:GWxTD domain-containing protein
MIALLSALLLTVQADTTAQLHLYRYWRAPDITNVVGFVSVPLAGLTYADDADGRSRVARYDIDMTIIDADGNVLLRQDWGNRVRVGMAAIPPTSRAVENVSFDLKPGDYGIAVEVRDSISGESTRVEESLAASGHRPLLGSLMLAHSIDRLEEGEQAPAGSLLRNGLAIAPNLQGSVSAEDATIRLYTEVYPPAGEGGASEVASVQVVLAPEGNPEARQEAPAIQKRYPADGGLELLQLPVAGLAPGPYSVGIRVSFPDTAVTTLERFELSAPAVATPTRTASTMELFPSLSDAQLDSVYQKADMLATPRERRLYRGLSAEGKRNFLEDFWARRDPIPGDPNEAYQEFTERVEYANREFDSSGNPGEGWSSARGRVWILRGPPFERLQRTTNPEDEPGRRGNERRRAERQYEIWRYAGGRNDIFVFFDQTGFGNFHQIYSTDPQEFTQPHWEELFEDAVVTLIRSLGGTPGR